ncbi:MAG: hypothetical protein ACKOYP_13310, partial [Bacteroidota bacterium]
VNLAGFYGYFLVRLQEIHAEARAALRNLPESKLQRFEFSSDTYRKLIVEDGEIRVNGRMHDIARTEYTGTSVIVWALHDEAEDNLFAFINKVTDNARGDDQQAPSGLTRFLSLHFLQPILPALVPVTASLCNHSTRWTAADPQSIPDNTWMPPEQG